MYSPRPFRIEDLNTMADMLGRNPMATLISNGETYPLATHIPLYLEQKEGTHYLVGHAARANEQIRRLENNSAVTAIFQGPHGYISSYAKDPEGMSILPTWDYQIVEVRGRLNFVDETRLREMLVDLLARQEKGEPKEMNLDDYPQDVLKQKMKAIIGMEIKIEEAVGCFRLNQNRTPEERQHIINRLKATPGTEQLIAEIKRFNP